MTQEVGQTFRLMPVLISPATFQYKGKVIESYAGRWGDAVSIPIDISLTGDYRFNFIMAYTEKYSD